MTKFCILKTGQLFKQHPNTGSITKFCKLKTGQLVKQHPNTGNITKCCKLKKGQLLKLLNLVLESLLVIFGKLSPCLIHLYKSYLINAHLFSFLLVIPTVENAKLFNPS